MGTSPRIRPERTYPAIVKVGATIDIVTAALSDGRLVSIPTAWFAQLAGASVADLKAYEISASGYGIRWSRLDEDISVKAFLD